MDLFLCLSTASHALQPSRIPDQSAYSLSIFLLLRQAIVDMDTLSEESFDEPAYGVCSTVSPSGFSNATLSGHIYNAFIYVLANRFYAESNFA